MSKHCFFTIVLLIASLYFSACSSKQEKLNALYPEWTVTKDSVYQTFNKISSSINFTNKSVLTMAESHIYSRHLDSSIQNTLNVYEKKQSNELLNQTILKESFGVWVAKTEKLDTQLQLAISDKDKAEGINIENVQQSIDSIKVQYKAYQIKAQQAFSASTNTEKAFSDLLNQSIEAYNKKAQSVQN